VKIFFFIFFDDFFTQNFRLEDNIPKAELDEAAAATLKPCWSFFGVFLGHSLLQRETFHFMLYQRAKTTFLRKKFKEKLIIKTEP
jgi:hypothetical protein